MRDELISLLVNDNQKLTFGKLRKLFKKENELLKKTLFSLEKEGLIYFDGTFYSKMPKDYYVCEIMQNKAGKYHISIDDKNISMISRDLNGALNGDIAVITKNNKGKYYVVKVLERKHERLVVEVKVNELMHKYLEPIGVGQTFEISVPQSEMERLTLGQRVQVIFTNSVYENKYEGHIGETVGFKNDPDIDLKTIAASNNFNTTFPKEVLEEIEKIPDKVTESDLEGREDLRDKEIFTIDGSHTKDMDDAVSIEKLSNGNYLLGVHIAQPSYYVKKGTALYNEALTRGNSLYMADTVIPMFPQFLSNGICSLNEGEDRLTRTVFMEIDNTGNVVDYKITKSVINSKKKMTYEDVNEILENNNIVPGYEKFVSSLKMMKELSDILYQKRESNGLVNFELDKAELVYDDNGNVNGSKIISRGTSERMIENFMIYANVTIAGYAYYLDLPFVYRNHGIPDVKYFNEIITLISSLGFHLEKVKNVDDPVIIQKILQALSNKDEYPILSGLILRGMKRANYSSDNLGHYGIAESYYTHFTSPIRRLADLEVHSLLDYYDDAKDLDEVKLNALTSDIDYVCERASMQERNADAAEYAAYKLGCVNLMKDYVGSSYDAVILDINEYFMTVRNEDGIEGIIDLRSLGGYEYDYHRKFIRLKDNTILKISYKINVTLEAVSKEERQLYFTYNNLIDSKVLTRTL